MGLNPTQFKRSLVAMINESLADKLPFARQSAPNIAAVKIDPALRCEIFWVGTGSLKVRVTAPGGVVRRTFEVKITEKAKK